MRNCHVVKTVGHTGLARKNHYDPNRHAMLMKLTYDENGRPLFRYSPSDENPETTA